MKILITGASGFLGRALISAQAGSGDDLVLCSRNSLKLQDLPYPLTTWDEPVPEGTDAVIHCAAKTPGADFTSVDDQRGIFFSANLERTRQILEKCRLAGVKKFVFISSHAVSESFRADAYTESKRRAEELVRNSELNWVIIRPVGIYGLNAYWVKQIHYYLHTRKVVINGDGNFPMRLIFVDDCAQFIVKVVKDMDSDMSNRLVDLFVPDKLTYRQMLEDIRKVLDAKFKIIRRPLWMLGIGSAVLGFVNPETMNTMKRIRRQYQLKPDTPVNDVPGIQGNRPFIEGFRDMYEQGKWQGLF